VYGVHFIGIQIVHTTEFGIKNDSTPEFGIQRVHTTQFGIHLSISLSLNYRRKVCERLLKKWLIVLILMVKLISFTKIPLLIVVNGVVKLDEIQ